MKGIIPKNNNGITMIALVITIIIMLILVTVSVTGAINGGIFNYAKRAKEQVNEVVDDQQSKFNQIVAEETGKNRNGAWNGKVNTPNILRTGLTAIYWDGSKWVTLTNTSTKEEWDNWYDYDNKQWANARTKDGSMWVWIPRYEYKIDSENKTIDIRFISTDVKEGTTGYTKDASGIITSSDGYIIHPAFINDSGNNYENGGWDKELSGIWVAKYEAGFQYGTPGQTVGTVEYSNLAYTSFDWKSGDNTGTYTSNFLETTLTAGTTKMSYPVFKPSTYSYNIISTGDAFMLSREVAKASMYGLTNVDSHMMKNSEWGAVVYLAQSKYGLNGNSSDMNEITVNEKNLGNGVYVKNDSTTGVRANVYAVTGYGGTTENNVNASTTKNIYGVFDLSGGVWERVAGFRKGGAAYNVDWHRDMAISTTASSTKYVTLYTSNNKKGDAMNETSGWNGDYAYFVGSSSPVVSRGGYYGYGSGAGAFAFHSSNGYAFYNHGFRVCLVQ